MSTFPVTTLASQMLYLVPSWKCCAFISSVHDQLEHMETAVWQFTKQLFCAQSQMGEHSIPTKRQLKLYTLLLSYLSPGTLHLEGNSSWTKMQNFKVLSIDQNQLTEITEVLFTRIFSGLNPCLTYLVKIECFTVLRALICIFPLLRKSLSTS